MVEEVANLRLLTHATETADYTPVILNIGGHECLCFPQVSENKAPPCLTSKRLKVLII
jgi:hypothetical protein